MSWEQEPGGQRWRRVREQVNRVWADDDPPTLIHAVPPLDLWDVQRPLPAPVDVEQQRSFDFAHRVGAVMLARGASMEDVEASIRAAALAMGLPSPEVDVTFTSIVVSVRPDPGQPPLTSVSVVRQRSDDHSRLADAHQLLIALAAGKLDRKAAFDRLAAHREPAAPVRARTPSRSPAASSPGRSWRSWAAPGRARSWWPRSPCSSTSSGAGWGGAACPTFYLNVVAGLIATLAAAVTTLIGAQQTPSLVVAGSIVVLLPGGTLVNGVRDAHQRLRRHRDGTGLRGAPRRVRARRRRRARAGPEPGLRRGHVGRPGHARPGRPARPGRLRRGRRDGGRDHLLHPLPARCPPPRCRAPSACSCSPSSRRSGSSVCPATRWPRSSSASAATSWRTPSARCR